MKRKQSHEGLKGKRVPTRSPSTKDRRPAETKPAKSGKGGVGDGFGHMGPHNLGKKG